MSDQEMQVPKKGRTKKNGEPDMRSVKSALNVSKARSKVKAFVKMGKQIIEKSDSEDSGDEIIDLVIRKKDEPMQMSQEEPSLIRRKPKYSRKRPRSPNFTSPTQMNQNPNPMK